jgi:hypothetical protein
LKLKTAFTCNEKLRFLVTCILQWRPLPLFIEHWNCDCLAIGGRCNLPLWFLQYAGCNQGIAKLGFGFHRVQSWLLSVFFPLYIYIKKKMVLLGSWWWSSYVILEKHSPFWKPKATLSLFGDGVAMLASSIKKSFWWSE